MEGDFVFVAQRGDRRLWIGIGEFVFRQSKLLQHQHPSGGGQFNGRAQAGYTSAYHHEVGLGRKTLHRRRTMKTGNGTTKGPGSLSSSYAIMEPHAASDHPRASEAISGLNRERP